MTSLVREPLVVRTALTALVTALLHVAVLQGWVSVESVSQETVAGVVDAIGLVVATLWARQAVTPVADPVLATTVYTRVNELPSEEAVTVEPEPVTLQDPEPETIDNL